jgi:hypothetical protein
MGIFQQMPPVSVGVHVHKFGYNSDVDASTGADEDVIAVGGTQYLPSAGVAGASINITSGSGDDDGTPAPGGTGARTLVIQGLDANGYLQSETVTLNGAANVNPTGTYLRIFRAYVATVGTGLTNAGAITIADGSGTFAYIPAGAGQTLQATYTVPADYAAGHLLQWYLTIASKTAAYVDAVLRAKPNGGAWRTFEWVGVHSTNPFIYNYPMPLKVDPLTDIAITVVGASGDNLPISAGFDMFLR